MVLLSLVARVLAIASCVGGLVWVWLVLGVVICCSGGLVWFAWLWVISLGGVGCLCICLGVGVWLIVVVWGLFSCIVGFVTNSVDFCDFFIEVFWFYILCWLLCCSGCCGF